MPYIADELMVILEYCRFGNIHNILLKNRSDFVNQINPQTDHIDPSYHIDTLIDIDTDSHDEGRHISPYCPFHIFPKNFPKYLRLYIIF